MATETYGRLLAACVVGGTLAVTSVSASAQGSGFYAGVGAGMTSADICDDLVGLGLTSCDDDDMGFKVYGGKSFNQNFSAEIGWIDLGEIKVTGPGGAGKVGVDGFQIAGLGIVPVSPQVSFFGKFGLYLWDVSASGPGGSLSDDGSDIMFGLGLNWNLAKQLDLRAEWERFDVDGDDVNMFSAGVLFRF